MGFVIYSQSLKDKNFKYLCSSEAVLNFDSEPSEVLFLWGRLGFDSESN